MEEQKKLDQIEHDRMRIKVTEFVTVGELANLMRVSVAEVIQKVMGLGIMVSINQRLDKDTITLVSDEFGFQVDFEKEFTSEALSDIEDDEEIETCFAIVMGVAFPEQIPELFAATEDNFLSMDAANPDLEAQLFAMLPDAVALLQEYAHNAGDGFVRTPDNYPGPPQPLNVEKIGRNEPCPCGSGLKHKKCCGK